MQRVSYFTYDGRWIIGGHVAKAFRESMDPDCDSILLDSIAYAPPEGLSVYQFCRLQGITLPCFCYHAKLSIAGNCRMCLVEVNEALAISCALPLAPAMSILTQTARLRHSREGILEFLLVNHPLDCPICDQGGECDLQDISFTFGSDRGRFFGFKRAVDNLNCLGPLIKTVMSRCIHCTRCVRFLQEYTAFPSLGTLGRGSSMEIGTYLNHFPMEELGANIIDLCPVGALTAMPYAFSYRPWELLSFESVDIFDALASSLRFDIVNNRLIRVLPVLDETCNEEWISNRARFCLDSLSSQRLLYPKASSSGSYYVIAWPRALYLFIKHLFFSAHSSLQAICSHFLDLTTSLTLKNFFHSFGCANIFYENIFYRKSDLRYFYLFGSSLLSLETSSLFLLIALNLRFEAPLLNSRLRKNYLNNFSDTSFYSLGLALDYLTFPVINLGNSMNSLYSLLEGKLPSCGRLLNFSFMNFSFLHVAFETLLQPFILLGSSIFHRRDGNSLASSCFQLRYSPGFHSFSIYFVSDYLGKISFLESAFAYRFSKEALPSPSFLWLLGAHFFKASLSENDSFIVFQGSYKNFLSHRANLLLPVKAHGEQSLSYLNLNGYWRVAKTAITAFRLTFSDLEILSILNLSRKRFFFSNFSFLSNFYYLFSFFLSFIAYRTYFLGESLESKGNFERFFALRPSHPHSLLGGLFPLSLNSWASTGKLLNTLFSKLVYNYYSDNIYSKNSKVMSLCAAKVFFSSFSSVET